MQAWGPAEPQKPQNLGVTPCVRDPSTPWVRWEVETEKVPEASQANDKGDPVSNKMEDEERQLRFACDLLTHTRHGHAYTHRLTDTGK